MDLMTFVARYHN